MKLEAMTREELAAHVSACLSMLSGMADGDAEHCGRCGGCQRLKTSISEECGMCRVCRYLERAA
jgi:hypothetical protein